MPHRIVRFIALFLCLFAASWVSASADAASDAKTAIQANYNKLNAALAKKDVSAVEALLAKDMTSHSNRGSKRDRQTYLAALRQLMSMTKSIKVTTKVETVTIKGSAATAATRENANVILTNPRDGSTANLKSDARGQDVWVKSGSRWLLQRSREVSSKATLNGRPVPNN